MIRSTRLAGWSDLTRIGNLHGEKKCPEDFPWDVQENVPADGLTCLNGKMETTHAVFTQRPDIQGNAYVSTATKP